MDIETKKRERGRPIGKEFEIFKGIKINEDQAKNWDKNTPKLIRKLLEGKFVSIELLKNLHDLMNEKMEFKKTPDPSDIELIRKIDLVMK